MAPSSVSHDANGSKRTRPFPKPGAEKQTIERKVPQVIDLTNTSEEEEAVEQQIADEVEQQIEVLVPAKNQVSIFSFLNLCATSAQEVAQKEVRNVEDSREQLEKDMESVSLRDTAPHVMGMKDTDEPKPKGTTDQPKPRTGSWGPFSWFNNSSSNPVEASGEDKDDDDSSAEGKLFGDLQSLPASTKGDIAISGGTVKTTDFAGCADKSVAVRSVAASDVNVETIVENKVRDINDAGKMPDIEEGNEASQEMIGGGTSAESRRLLLVNQLRTAIATQGRYDLSVADISAALGDLLNESKEHEQAVKLHRDATVIYSTKKGDANTITISAKNRLGQVLEDAGQFDEAISTYYGVMVMQRALKGDKDPATADALVQMAIALRGQGDYTQAIKELKRALKVYRESLGDSDEKVSTTVDEIASLYVTIGDFEKSAAILEEVVKLKAATMGMRSDAVAVTMISLATTYECSEQFDKAMKSLKKAYKIYTELGGYSSEKATATLNRIARLYEAIGDFNRASIAYLGVLRGRKINLGDDHLQVGEIYYKLGHSLRKTGQLEKALKCMKESLPIYVGKGVEMYDVEMIAEVMHEMALINKEKKFFTEALRIFKQELSVRRKIGQPEFPLVARTLNQLGLIEYELKNNSRALRYLVEALTIYQERGEHGVDCAEVLVNAGLVFQSVKNQARAIDAFTEAARIFEERGYNEDNPHLATAKAGLAKMSSNKI